MHLIGHQTQFDQLQRAANSNQLAHSYLFTGIDGIGKKMAAIAFTMGLFCDSGKPCGNCIQCRKVENNLHPDLTILAAEKKDITIEQVREMQAKIQMHPLEAKYKIIIIDDAEKMNAAAANSLLKTLEEPPAATHFFLITSRMHMLLPTIISRCQKITFSPPSVDHVVPIIQKKLEIDARSAHLLVNICDGSIGAALTFQMELLEDVMSSMQKIWSQPKASEILSIAERWSRPDMHHATILSVIAKIYHNILAYQTTGQPPLFDKLAGQIAMMAKNKPMQAIQKNFSSITAAQSDIEATYNKQLMFEQLLLSLI